MQNCMKLMEISGIHLTLQEEASEMDIEEWGHLKPAPLQICLGTMLTQFFALEGLGDKNNLGNILKWVLKTKKYHFCVLFA